MSRNRNNYALNNSQSYNASYTPTKRFYVNENASSFPVQQNDSNYKYLLTGGDVSGTVWMNQSYNVAEEDPGISWIL